MQDPDAYSRDDEEEDDDEDDGVDMVVEVRPKDLYIISGFCVKFFPTNKRPHNCQPIHQSFTL